MRLALLVLTTLLALPAAAQETTLPFDWDGGDPKVTLPGGEHSLREWAAMLSASDAYRVSYTGPVRRIRLAGGKTTLWGGLTALARQEGIVPIPWRRGMIGLSIEPPRLAAAVASGPFHLTVREVGLIGTRTLQLEVWIDPLRPPAAPIVLEPGERWSLLLASGKTVPMRVAQTQQHGPRWRRVLQCPVKGISAADRARPAGLVGKLPVRVPRAVRVLRATPGTPRVTDASTGLVLQMGEIGMGDEWARVPLEVARLPRATALWFHRVSLDWSGGMGTIVDQEWGQLDLSRMVMKLPRGEGEPVALRVAYYSRYERRDVAARVPGIRLPGPQSAPRLGGRLTIRNAPADRQRIVVGYRRIDGPGNGELQSWFDPTAIGAGAFRSWSIQGYLEWSEGELRYGLPELAPGKYQVWLRALRNCIVIREVVVPPRGGVRVDLAVNCARVARVTGTIKRRGGLDPETDIFVYLVPLDPKGQPRLRELTDTITGRTTRDGSFAIPFVPLGTYRVLLENWDDPLKPHVVRDRIALTAKGRDLTWELPEGWLSEDERKDQWLHERFHEDKRKQDRKPSD